MKELKYIIVDERGIEVPVVFSALLSHGDMCGYETAVAAGFCKISATDYTFVCWGESITLGVKSRGVTDELILDEFFQLPVKG